MRISETIRLKEGLRRELSTELPGHDAFLELSGYKRPDLDTALRLDPSPRESAVLVLFYPHQELLHTLLMLRPTYQGVHSGQVAFPGGRREAQDPDLFSTALREFREETGALPEGLELLGELSRVYIPPSHSLVTPYVAFATALGPTLPDPREVAALIETPVEEILRDDILKHREQFVHGMGRTTNIPYYDIRGHVVWGATAMMLAELRELMHRL